VTSTAKHHPRVLSTSSLPTGSSPILHPAAVPDEGASDFLLAMSTPRPSALQQQQGTNSHSPGPSSRIQSPISSRDSSPAGPFMNRNNNFSSASTTASTASRGMRSRKNSHEVSPQRSQPSGSSGAPSSAAPPTAAALQKALSSATIPELQPSTASDSSRLPRATKNGIAKDVPSWPVSPRLKSPPPSSNSRRSSAARPQQRRGESGAASSSSAAPDIVVQAPANLPDESSETEGQAVKHTARTGNAISTLETVQETNTPVANDPASNK
jgi:hypothetical protein